MAHRGKQGQAKPPAAPSTRSRATGTAPAATLVGAIAGVAAPLVLGLLFASAYQALDQMEPNVGEARAYHVSVVVLGLVFAAALAVGAIGHRPVILVALVFGALGLVLVETATSYSTPVCHEGFFSSDCDREGDRSGALIGWMLGLTVLAGGGGGLAALSSRDAMWSVMIGVGLAAAAAYTVASAILLPRLAEEAEKARASNVPVTHDVPGLGLALVLAALVAVAVAWRRQRG